MELACDSIASKKLEVVGQLTGRNSSSPDVQPVDISI